MRRYFNILIVTISTIIFMAAGTSYAQQVPIPNPNWPLDSVVNKSVHFYTVKGDPNYQDSSYFVWTVSGGKLFYDQGATLMAGDGTTATVRGNGENVTRLWVEWNLLNVSLDTGYVYVYEISADSCQRPDTDEGKYQGMRIKVSAPPDARFISERTIACSNLKTAQIIIEIEGMPPYDLVYTLNYGEQITWHITAADLSDLDNDGKANNVAFYYTDLDTVTSDMAYVYQLDTVSSGGVYGHILDHSSHELIVHLQPPAPVIGHEWTEVTIGSNHTYYLDNPGVNAEKWFWTLRDIYSNQVNDYNSTTQSSFNVTFLNNLTPGWYYTEVQYVDTFGCYSPFDSLNIELFDIPTIAFSDTTTVMNCSATSLVPNDQFEFVVEYTGALKYGYTYVIYDETNTPLGGGVIDPLTNRSDTLRIFNNFINESENIKPWTVKITEAHNEEGVDANIIEGRDEKIIMIYPKPIILDDIDFAN